MPEEEIIDKKELTSEFNEAQLQVMRISELWRSYHACIKEPNYRDGNKTLNSIWVELSTDAKFKNREKYFKGIDMLDKKIMALHDNPDKLEIALNMKAIFLKDLQEVAGKGSKRKEKYEHM